MERNLAASAAPSLVTPASRTRWPGPPRPVTLLHVAALLVPLSLIVLGCKLHKGLTLSSDLGFGDVVGLLAQDVGFLGLYGLGWTVALAAGAGRRWLRWATGSAFHVVTFTLMVVAVIEHGFFVATGTSLDWYMVEYGYQNFGALKDVIASEVKAPVWIGFGTLVLLVTAPLALARLPFVRRLAAREVSAGDWTRPWAVPLHASVVLTIALGLGLTGGSVADDLVSLRQNVYVDLGGEAIAAALTPPAEEIARAAEPWSPLRVTATQATRRHNVVLVVLESSRASAFSPYGAPADLTPNFTKLADRGRLVKNGYTVIPHTSKALVAIQCGMYPKIATPIDEAAPGALPSECLAGILREEGYATAFFQPAEENFERRRELVANFGFEHFVGREGLAEAGYKESNYFGYEDDAMIGPAMAWVDEVSKKGPFLLSVLTLTAHHNYQIPPGFKRRKLADNPTLDRYLNTIAYTDRFLGKLVDELDRRGRLEDTLFLVVGDHGEAFGEHKRNQHDNVLYEEGVHVPMLVAGPGVEPGSPIEGLRQSIDIVPTVLDLLGYDVRGGLIAGKSLMEPEGHDRIYTSCWYKDNCMAVRVGPRKILYHYQKRGLEVFNVVDDPGETVNLAGEGNSLTRLEIDAAIEDMKGWKERVNAIYAAGSRSQKEKFVSRTAPTPRFPLDVQLGEHVKLIGYDLESTELVVGVPTVVTYYFQVLGNPGPGWRLFTHLEGPKFINVDHTAVEGTYPASEWQAGEYIEDRHTFRINPGRPAGRYKLKIGLYDEGGKGLEARALPVDLRKQGGEPGVEIDDKRRVTIATFEATDPKNAIVEDGHTDGH